jgi:uncharacterized FAD-dependent dehydrogenase
MEIKGIDNPFEWSRDVVSKIQKKGTGLYYSPKETRQPSLTSEGNVVSATSISLNTLITEISPTFEGYFSYIIDFIEQMNEVFKFGEDWGMYIPEVKYLSAEPQVNYSDLSLLSFPNVHFVGDALSARGITVSGAHGIYVAENILGK